LRPPTAGPAGPHRDDALDGLRGAAAFLIYFYHLGLNLGRPPLRVWGFTGVQVFFVLSGYLISGPFLAALRGDRPSPDLRRYAARRFLRIYPPYAVALALFAAVRFAQDLKPPDPRNLVTHALLVFNLLGPRDFFGVNAVFWSLAVEAQFYVILPAAAWSTMRLTGRRGRGLAWGFVTAFVVLGLGARAWEFLRSAGPGSVTAGTRFVGPMAFLDLFGAGMVVACLADQWGDRLARRPSTRLGLVAAGLAVYLTANAWSTAVAPQGWMLGPDLVYTLGFPAAICGATALGLVGVVTRPAGVPCRPLTWPPLVAVGAASYSLYLYHNGVQFLAWKLIPFGRLPAAAADPLAVALLALPPTLALAALMYRLVERPSLRLGLRDSSHPRAAAEAVGLADPSSART